jgi:hypothetical protein
MITRFYDFVKTKVEEPYQQENAGLIPFLAKLQLEQFPQPDLKYRSDWVESRT